MSIKIKDLSFSYGTRRCAGAGRGQGPYDVLRHIDLDLPDGCLVNVLGPNGAGKSTLFRCMLCLEDGYTGSIAIDGRDLRRMSVRERARTIAYIPQAHESVYDYSVLDVVLMSAASQTGAFGVPCADQVKRAWEALERVGIARLAHRPATRISGGEQQRIAIARAMLKNAPILILDEATAFADPDNEAKVQAAFAQLAKGKTVLMIAHRLSTVANADCIYVVQDGQIVESGTKDELCAQNGLFARMWQDYQASVQWKVAKEG